MNGKVKIGIVKKAIECCFVKGSCYPCPFYQEPTNGRPGRCLGMKSAGKLIIEYLGDVEVELCQRNQK